jgi:hypothetical protein
MEDGRALSKTLCRGQESGLTRLLRGPRGIKNLPCRAEIIFNPCHHSGCLEGKIRLDLLFYRPLTLSLLWLPYHFSMTDEVSTFTPTR